jgi:hypothetical protein
MSIANSNEHATATGAGGHLRQWGTVGRAGILHGLWRDLWTRLANTNPYGEFVAQGSRSANRNLEALRSVSMKPGRDVFFSYTTGCLETVMHLRDHGVRCIVDQIDPARWEADLVNKEEERWPGWEQARSTHIPDQYWERLEAEWQAANVAVVNSEWSAEGLRH